MGIRISHITAFLLLAHSPNLRPTAQRHSFEASHFDRPRAHEAEMLIEEFAARGIPLKGRKVDSLVFGANSRRRSSSMRSHTCSWKPPRSAFLDAGIDESGDFCVTSPEFTFALLAGCTPLADLVWCGMVLCSGFRFDERASGGIVQREGDDGPLATKTAIARFIEKAPNFAGKQRALKALEYVHDNAKSPIEIALAMCFEFGMSDGGFSLGHIEFNKEMRLFVGVDAFGQRIYQTRMPDLTISACKNGVTTTVGVEYDSNAFHQATSRRQRDAERRNQFLADGRMATISITRSVIADFTRFELTAYQLRRMLGLRKYPFLRLGLDAPESQRRIEEIRAAQFNLWARYVSTRNPLRIELK